MNKKCKFIINFLNKIYLNFQILKVKQRLARKPCNQKTFNQAQTQTIQIVSLVNPYENQLRSTDFENTLPQHSINPNETFNFETNFNFTQINPTSSEISNLVSSFNSIIFLINHLTG